MVVNGSRESDWPDVLNLAREHPQVLPSFGYHPWFIKERTETWRESLVYHLNQTGSAIGEIGLDRWIEGFDLAAQEEVFVWQWRLAKERELPASVHCLKAWGLLLEILEREGALTRGFLLHSYGGPVEMIPALVKLGAYFSIPGCFAEAKRERRQEAFRQVPRDRLLIETDAPAQLPPPDLILYPLSDGHEPPPNHPGNLRAIYGFTASLLGVPVDVLVAEVAENFRRLFGRDPGGQA